MPAASTSSSAAPPVFGTAALAILGTMVLLIAALTVVLIQTSWAPAAASSVERSAPAGQTAERLAHR